MLHLRSFLVFEIFDHCLVEGVTHRQSIAQFVSCRGRLRSRFLSAATSAAEMTTTGYGTGVAVEVQSVQWMATFVMPLTALFWGLAISFLYDAVKPQ
jgi:hypothetical protein